MCIHRGLGNREISGDILIALALREEHQNIHLLRRQPRQTARPIRDPGDRRPQTYSACRAPKRCPDDLGSGEVPVDCFPKPPPSTVLRTSPIVPMRADFGMNPEAPKSSARWTTFGALRCRYDDYGNGGMLRPDVKQQCGSSGTWHKQVEQNQIDIAMLYNCFLKRGERRTQCETADGRPR